MQCNKTFKLIDDSIIYQFYCKCDEFNEIYIDVTIGDYEMMVKALINSALKLITLNAIDTAITVLKSACDVSYAMNAYASENYGYSEFGFSQIEDGLYEQIKRSFEKETTQFCSCGNYPCYNDKVTPKYCTNCNKPENPNGYYE